MSRLRVVFMGSPEFALPSLQALAHDPEFEIVGVFCQPDRPKGRGNQITPTPVKSAATRLGLPVWTPASLKKEPAAVEQLRSLKPDYLVVVAYGLMLPADVLAIPRVGAVNLHGSLLPKHRGAAPVQAAIMAGDEITGNTIMLINEKLDAGAMLASQEVPIAANDTSGSVLRTLAERGAPLLVQTLKEFAAGRLTPVAQDDTKATFAPKITTEMAQLDWNLPAGVLAQRIRALFPNPGCWFWLGEMQCKVGEAVVAAATHAGTAPGTVLQSDPATGFVVACQNGSALQLRHLQKPGKTMMAAAAFLRGNPVAVGTVLPAASNR